MNEIIKPLLKATLDKYPELSDKIWAKVHYMVNDKCVRKFVVRHSSVVIDDSDTCTEEHIGLRSSTNRRLRKSTLFVLKQFGRGLTIKRDREGNVYCSSQSSSDSSSCHLEVVGWQRPQLQSLSPDIVRSRGRIDTDLTKVFDMCEYKSHVAMELQNQKVDQEKLHQLSVFSISIIPESPAAATPAGAAAAAPETVETLKETNADDAVPPYWLCIINLSAIDVLISPKVIADIKAMQHLDLIRLDDTQLRRNWSRHELQKRSDLQEAEEGREDGRKVSRRKQQDNRKSKKEAIGPTKYSWMEKEESNGSQPIRRIFSSHTHKESLPGERQEWSALIGL